MKDGDHTLIELVSPPCDPIATPQASSVPHEEPLYDAFVTQDQRVPYMMGPAGNVPTSSVQEAQYSWPDTLKTNMDIYFETQMY